MDKKTVRDFLVGRRARVTPEQAGIPVYGDDRRVPGLRREEVAMLAGVSIDYYTRLERGNIGGASDGVLDAIARALRLDDVERAHLFDLARAASAPRARAVPPLPHGVRPSVQRMLDSMGAPAIVHNARQDLVAANRLGRALYSPHFDTDRRPPNMARFVFLDPRARDYYVDWPLARRTTAAMLRLEAGRNPMDGELTALVGELSARSAVFARDWADHDVHRHRTGRKSFRHPDVGLIEVDFDVFEPAGEERLWIVGYTAEPGTPSADAVALLGTLTATREEADREHHGTAPDA
ncbi:helix-turn-helix transcriptional regulator [Nocardiopsis changdeensis]|uniref:Helix-turn-helix domain-containing protein n=1 Tax=Nocardiopsis changdeensis TaxID=2831969 RepID=A0ABX8BDZ4_9ACTN|nr:MULTISPECIES: helix-turn-helix transcriptional regulator [Nocardiopsis]QUX20477.1 helix-turn-helix domain-containing protein [Nocardiopsis changdeensis]QYX36408.1 helix-turn-helix transcriptional regulator [Nocardiopsis sp. MT53]